MAALPKLLLSLHSTHAKIADRDHYALLGLHWSSYAELIEQAYAHEKALVDPAHYPDTLPDADLAARQEVDEALDAAYNVLREPTLRRQYREEMVDRMNLESAIGLYWEKADTALMRNDAEGALEFVQRVLELSPRHPDARSRLTALQKLR